MHQIPTTHRIDPSTGSMSNATGHYEKRLKDLAGIYGNAQAFEHAASGAGDRIVYTVHEARPTATQGDLIFGTTFMEPGQIGGEYFMTRGHIHARANRPETYYGESGQGVMLLETPEGETKIMEISPKVLIYVPPLWIHRSVNTGDTPLVMSFCYPSDSGQDYGVIARSGGMAKRIVANGDDWSAIDNTSYRPRDADEIARIYSTTD
ncbi:glucose-6-phosphate isomerase family protein [Litoreibacter albidus]|uniref:glucose-6-phosphate isomerase n=1 Tax=Litoreibacter albidus TaxID=670155 RepID=A0A1H3CKT9_9RHOB|nr:glucose-6-phosphate isomerase family protein [Litoreibacter albidus]SDX54771.1 glucose-6-phosphate isomerase [Litoreibacter albidus]